MQRKSDARLKKVNEAVRILRTTTGLKVPQAMILARFSKGNIANESVHRMMIRCCLAAQQVTPHPPCIQFGASGKDSEDLSDLTRVAEAR